MAAFTLGGGGCNSASDRARKPALVPEEGGCDSARDRARRLLNAWRQDTNAYHEQFEAVEGLGEDAAPILRILLDQVDDAVCSMAFDLIGKFEYPDMSVEEYFKMQGDSMMGKREPPEPKRVPWLGPVLLDACKNDSRFVRQVAVRMLPTHVPDCFPVLIEATGDADLSVRACAFWGMRRVSGPVPADVAPAINRGMMDTSDMVRSSAIMTAAVRRVTAALPALEALLEDDSIIQHRAFVSCKIIWSVVPRREGDPGAGFEPRINEIAAYAIQEITGKDFGFTTCFDSRPRMPEIVERIREAKLVAP